MNTEYAQKMKRCHEYLESLEEEQRKIQVFRRELPLCLELVTKAIEACRKELSGSPTTECLQGGQSECSEQTTSDDGGPVLEEFIPIKRRSSSDEDEEESREFRNDGDKKKSDWLRSVQLWNNQTPDPPSKEEAAKNADVVEVRKNGGAFHPFNNQEKTNNILVVGKPTASLPAVSTTSSTTENDGNVKKEDKEANPSRKQRRNWSPALHSRFIQALKQLGGSHAATPKQIRELMNVDGLTNDEVKSHLQKYRLHSRRPTQSVHNNPPRGPQFLVVGGIWMPPPPPEYAVATGETARIAPSSRIFAPVAAAPVPTGKRPRPLDSEKRGVNVILPNSPTSSSSTHTTTTNSPIRCHG